MSLHSHLRRLAVVWEKTPVYLITTCIANRRPVLANAAAHDVLLREWRELRPRYGWYVGRYVIMPDHVHFFVAPKSCTQFPLRTVIGKWKEWSSKRLRIKTGLNGALWQAGFFDHLLRSHESRSEKWEYVYANPVRAGLLSKAIDWPYAGAVDFE